MKQVSVSNLNLTAETPQTYLTTNTASGVSSLSVKNITGFLKNQVLLIGEMGNEGTEIIKTLAATDPSGSTIDLATATTTAFPHSAGTPVRLMLYDQVLFYSAPTVGGTQTLLGTKTITVDSMYTVYTDNLPTVGYYYSHFYNSLSTQSSSDSDAIPTGGYPITSARTVIDNALGMINKESSDTLTDTFSFNEINNCQMEVLRELKRWSFMQVYDANLGSLTTGQWKIVLPTDCDDQYSNKTIWNFKIGTGTNLTYVDKEKWNEITEGIAHTTLSPVGISVGALTAILSDSSDFQDSGTIYVGANTYSYTANNRTTNTLTLSVASTTTNTAGQDVFSGGSLGTPQYWTVIAGYIYFYPILCSTLNNRDGHLDYYKAPVSITSDSNTIVLADPTVVQYYLAWKMLLRMQSGKDDSTTQAMFSKYTTRVEKLKQKEVLGKIYKMRPLLNTLNMNVSTDDEQIRTGNFITY